MTMTERFGNRLGARILLAMGAVMLASSLIFLSIFAPIYHRQLLGEREMAPVKLGALLQITLQHAMLTRDLEGLRGMISDLGQSPNVAQATVLNPAGEVRFSSIPDEIGKSYNLQKLCPDCATLPDHSAQAGFVRAESGRDVMRSLRPVPNKPICGQCHGPVAAHPVNGYLLVDYDAADLRSHSWIIAGALAGAGLLVVVGALGATWAALRRSVLRPVGALAAAARDFDGEKFSSRALVEQEIGDRSDEIADLGRGFLDMAARLEKTIGELRARDLFQQALLDAIPDGVRVIAPDYSIVAANAQFCRQAGLSLEETLALPCYAASHDRSEPCVPTLVVCPLAETGANGKPVKCSHTHVNRTTGEAYAVEVVAAPLGGQENGGPRLIVESIRDLSRLVQVSQEQRLSELGQLAAGVAHEIYNPLSSIRLGLHAVRRGVESARTDAETLGFIDAVNTEIDRCLTVTERLMRLSRIPDERGVLVDVQHVIQDSVALLRYEAELCGVAVETSVEDQPRILANDADLGMVLLNLMQNALHAMPHGGALMVTANANADGAVEIVVADTGVGIARDHLQKIFHPFWSWRADSSAGCGLGLAICKSLVTKWGGSISVRSVLSEGATFKLSFPPAEKAIASI
jgi:signal transduction histidine kinase